MDPRLRGGDTDGGESGYPKRLLKSKNLRFCGADLSCLQTRGVRSDSVDAPLTWKDAGSPYLPGFLAS